MGCNCARTSAVPYTLTVFELTFTFALFLIRQTGKEGKRGNDEGSH